MMTTSTPALPGIRTRGALLITLALLAALLVILLAGAGCAFDDGEPWGRVETTLRAEPRFDTPRITIDSVEIGIRNVRYYGPGTGAGGAAGGDVPFDPANPPPGFSLCHGGHCHADDGRLVPYEEIGADAGPSVPILHAHTPVEDVLAPDAPLIVTSKVNDQASLDRLDVELSHFVVRGHVISADDTGDTTPLVVALPVNGARLGAPVALAIGRDEPKLQRLAADLVTPADLFADLPLDELRPAADGTITVSATRHREHAVALGERLLEAVELTIDR